MKKLLNILVNQLNYSQLENLTRETKETIAFNLVKVNKQIFTPADLWNIQRNAKPRSQRRFL